MSKITPSVYMCDTTKIYDEILALKEVGIDWIHFDIMDGHFVPNYALGPKQLDDIKKHFPDLVIDAHVMGNELENNIIQLKNADYITFHLNSKQSLGINSLISKIKNVGCKVGIAVDLNNTLEDVKPFLSQIELITVMSIRPGFSGQKFENSTWELLSQLINYCERNYPNIKIQIDGGVRWDNIKKLIDFKVDLIVVGSLLFNQSDYKNVVDKIKLL